MLVDYAAIPTPKSNDILINIIFEIYYTIIRTQKKRVKETIKKNRKEPESDSWDPAALKSEKFGLLYPVLTCCQWSSSQ